MIFSHKPTFYRIFMDKREEIPTDSIRIVSEGFSMRAAIFSIFWLLFHRIWSKAALILLAFIALGISYNTGFTDAAVTDVVRLAILAIIGFNACDWHAEALTNRGLEEIAVIAADSPSQAYIRFCDQDAASISPLLAP